MRKKSQSRLVFAPKKDFFVKLVKIFTNLGRPGPNFGINLVPYEPGVASKKLPYAGADRKSDRTRVLRRADALARWSASALVNFFTMKNFQKKVCEFSHNYGKIKNFTKISQKTLDFLVNVCYTENGLVRPEAARQLYHVWECLSSIFFDNLVSICV